MKIQSEALAKQKFVQEKLYLLLEAVDENIVASNYVKTPKKEYVYVFYRCGDMREIDITAADSHYAIAVDVVQKLFKGGEDNA